MTYPLTVIAGPTAVGKGTIVARLAAWYPRVWVSISATTRQPRQGEIDGVHYHFVSPRHFDAMIAAGEFLEWAVVHGHHKYGTPRAPVADALSAGRVPVLEIDLAGARQVRETMPTALFVFIAPPSFETLAERLATRGTEGAAERERRLATARVEMAAEAEFDAVVINDDLDVAVAELADLMELGEPADIIG